MKLMKRIAAIMLSVVMVLGMSSVVSAASTGSGTSATTKGKITIDNAIVGQTYKIYKILELESYDSTAGSYAYKVATGSGWEGFVTGTGSTYLTKDASGYVTWIGGSVATSYAEFAKKALAYAKDPSNGVTEAGTKEATTTTGATITTVEFTDLALGYYLVESSTGALCSLTTTANEITIQEKNGAPTVKKEVKKAEGTYANSNTASIGDTVEFKTTITAQPGAENYVLHDKMDAGLTFDNTSVVVKLKKSTDGTENNLTSGTEYTITSATGTGDPADGCTFEIKFTPTFCDNLEANDEIIVTYSATLNKNANTGATPGNTNETKLAYGDNKKTTESTTTTKTFEVPVFKYTEDTAGNKTGLAGAKFKLSTSDNLSAAGATAIKLTKLTGTTEDTYRVDKTGTVEEITTTNSISGSEGKFTIKGLGAGTYYLHETKQPDGYNKLKDPVKVVIAENGDITVGTVATVVTEVGVENKTGSLLPSTGGRGTTILYVLGALLVLGSSVVLITKRRMKE